MKKNIIYGKGIPSKSTQGRMGDVYRDEQTGKSYLCVFAYRESDKEPFECEWQLLDKEELNEASLKKDSESKNITSNVSNGMAKSEVEQNAEHIKLSIEDAKDDNISRSVTRDGKVSNRANSHKPGYTPYGKTN